MLCVAWSSQFPFNYRCDKRSRETLQTERITSKTFMYNRRFCREYTQSLDREKEREAEKKERKRE